jgi:hypothetical protein
LLEQVSALVVHSSALLAVLEAVTISACALGGKIAACAPAAQAAIKESAPIPCDTVFI